MEGFKKNLFSKLDLIPEIPNFWVEKNWGIFSHHFRESFGKGNQKGPQKGRGFIGQTFGLGKKKLIWVNKIWM